MDTILDNKYILMGATALGSSLLTILVQLVLNRRARFRYLVSHARVGISADDPIFGSVRVLWNNNPVANLYVSSIELVNDSARDFENVVVRVFTNDTILLTERAELIGTTRILNWAPEYAQQLRVISGQQPTQQQIDLHGRQRDYLVPTMNRGQVVRLTFLNAARGQTQPTLWLDILHRGVKAEIGVAQSQILGVAQPTAAWAGLLTGFVVVAAIISSVQTLWLGVVIAFVYGLVAQLPGACAVRLVRRVWGFFRG
jgi:hypothetical protein